MRRFRSNKKKQIPTKYTLWILSGICVVAIFIGLIFNISGGPLNTIAGYIFVPMQQGINNTGSWIFDKANDFKTMKEVMKENEELQKEVDDLRGQLNTIKLEQSELENYRELYQLDQKYPSFEKVAASVVAKDGSNWFSTFTINRGTNHGIKVGMNVLAGSGLVGIIIDAGPNYSKVRSIIDDTSNVSAMITNTGDNFIVSGNLKTMNESMVITFNELKDSDNQVKAGNQVVTSYVSDLYHQGILIGYISTIEDSPNNLTKMGTITPVVDFEHLEEVLVITKLKETSESGE